MFVLLLLFPSVVQFAHMFENHEHNYCGVSETHLHEKKIDCDLLKFISTAYNFENQAVTISSVKINFKEQDYQYTSIHSKIRSQSNYLRGPPTIQQLS